MRWIAERSSAGSKAVRALLGVTQGREEQSREAIASSWPNPVGVAIFSPKPVLKQSLAQALGQLRAGLGEKRFGSTALARRVEADFLFWQLISRIRSKRATRDESRKRIGVRPK